MKRALLCVAAVAIWVLLIGGAMAWDAHEVAVPTMSSPDVQTAIPVRLRSLPFPRSTTPPTWQPAFPYATPGKG